jgi:hypothetical protein
MVEEEFDKNTPEEGLDEDSDQDSLGVDDEEFDDED